MDLLPIYLAWIPQFNLIQSSYAPHVGFIIYTNHFDCGPLGNRTLLIFSVQARWPPHAVPKPIIVDYRCSLLSWTLSLSLRTIVVLNFSM